MERIIKATGIITRNSSYKDNDKFLTIFTKEYGKMDVAARGSKKPDSAIFAASSLFTYGNFQIYNNSGRYSLMQAEVIRSFYDLSLDLEKFGVADFMGAVCSIAAVEEQPALFALLLYLLDYLESGELTPKGALLVFSLKTSDIWGIRPNLNLCGVCGKETGQFSIEDGGLICGNCKKGSISLTAEEIVLMREILGTSNRELVTLHFDEDNNKTARVMVNYLLFHLDLPSRTTKFLHKIGML